VLSNLARLNTVSNIGGKIMSKFAFLSPEWIAEAKRIRDEFGSANGAMPGAVKMNLVITEVPFGDGSIDAHVDTSGQDADIDLGHLEGADVKITVGYDTAKEVFVQGNQQAAMQAFMAGKIKVEGDMAKLMAMQTAVPDPSALEITEKIKEITE
jgi:hypothetical protein